MEKLKLDKHGKSGRKMTKQQIVLDIISTLAKDEAATYVDIAQEAKKKYGAIISPTYVGDISRKEGCQSWIGSRAVAYNPKGE